VSVKIRWEGDNKNLLTAQEQIEKSLKKIEEKYKTTAKEARELDRIASQTMRNIQTPTEKYEKTMENLRRALGAGKISQDQFSRAVEQAVEELNDADESAKKTENSVSTFGRTAVAAATTAAAAFTAYKVVMQEVRAESQRMAKVLEDSVGSLGALGQLATGQGLGALTQQAQGLRTSGAVPSLDAANQLIFKLTSGGLGADVGTFQQIGQARLVEDLTGLAEAVSKFQQALTRAETGTTEAVLSKTLAAAKVSPNEAAQVITAAAEAGAAAAAARFTDEETLAAVAQISAVRGAGPAGTATRALFQQIEKQGVGKPTLVETIQGIAAAPGGPRDVLGDNEEALNAFRVLNTELPKLSTLIQEVNEANSGARLRAAVASNAQIPAIVASTELRRAAGQEEAAFAEFGTAETLRDAVDKQLDIFFAGQGRSRFGRAGFRILQNFYRSIGFGDVSEGQMARFEARAAETPGTQDDAALKELRRITRLLQESNNRLEQQQKVPVPSPPTEAQ
jgi:hypothetical protein